MRFALFSTTTTGWDRQFESFCVQLPVQAQQLVFAETEAFVQVKRKPAIHIIPVGLQFYAEMRAFCLVTTQSIAGGHCV